MSGYTATVRNVPTAERKTVFAEYHIPYANHAMYEVDHLISLELGGSNAIKNLWPEPYAGLAGARVKDKIENKLHALVCSGQISLAKAQRAIALNWWSAYHAYLKAPVTKGHPPVVVPPTVTPTTPSPPTSAPTTPGAPANLCGAPPNPYGYNFCGGTPVTTPAADICSYFACIASFADGTGYMAECNDGMYSRSGGLIGACSRHGGELRPVDL